MDSRRWLASSSSVGGKQGYAWLARPDSGLGCDAEFVDLSTGSTPVGLAEPLLIVPLSLPTGTCSRSRAADLPEIQPPAGRSHGLCPQHAGPRPPNPIDPVPAVPRIPQAPSLGLRLTTSCVAPEQTFRGIVPLLFLVAPPRSLLEMSKPCWREIPWSPDPGALGETRAGRAACVFLADKFTVV